MLNLFAQEINKLAEQMVAEGQKPYRATQLFTWIYEKKARSFDEMSDVSLKFREVLKEKYTLELPSLYLKQESSDGTIKCLVALKDGAKVETVLMRYSYGNAVCVSSQVGCNMGCSFCSSGQLGKQRNLTVDEMIGQILIINQLLEAEGKGEKVTHVVVMGTGEPFDNYDNLMDFIRIVNHPKGFEIGARHITVSTCGLPDGIRKYAHEGLQTNLAISLHAPNNELRNQLMKINKVYPLETLMPAIKEYEKVSGRRVTYEYLLLSELNDTKEYADQLINLIKGTMGYVNLIPYNETNLCSYKRSSGNRIHQFLDYLTKGGVTATIRKEFGSDIDAACGQLRAKVEKNII
ncbi:MAG: 23S rRNA (adenine(2503)-C(2))-methyltransferase RlmN [Erysipelotrichaceae bacterium]|jgi:23S rRNA (adenine2503-C2)-methyltransferase|nr:23S rRNA (adenine(2503)-C(2))-methyltransferase RlmN [Bacilli bacterium]NLV29227.1 23S rRNA (adenine(2503)-C(2))-methyltransferase RlmN [Erysipelotrichaceae bacterium]HPY79574.1 23S rRNA (adenine(2503)-C(2))-methyltransferase RlmN [Bacilli bacterium]HQA55951.1 23S rRNA (adenine(2503)-C(2))-methyltransferase RlmN [Bacilli bacterium]